MLSGDRGGDVMARFGGDEIRTKDALLRAADEALSTAKREGGRRVCVHQQEGQLYVPVQRPVRAAPPRGRAGG